MCAPNELPMCEVCLRRSRPDSWKLPDGRVVEWEGCLCDTPDEVRADWEAKGYPKLPMRRLKGDLYVNGRKVEGTVSYHPVAMSVINDGVTPEPDVVVNNGDMINMPPAPVPSPVDALRDQQQLLEAFANADAATVSKIKALLIEQPHGDDAASTAMYEGTEPNE